jgi:hypothetical protein
LVSKNDTYADINCSVNKYCFPCIAEGERVFNLRGVCKEQTMLDTDYIFLFDELKRGEITFRGVLGKSFITFNRLNQTWDLRMVQSKTETLVGVTKSDGFPLGLFTWSLFIDCNELVESPIKSQLKFTKARFIFS